MICNHHLDVRGRSIFRLVLLATICLTVGYTLRMIYYSGRNFSDFKISEIKVPTGLSWSSTSEALQNWRRPPSDASHPSTKIDQAPNFDGPSSFGADHEQVEPSAPNYSTETHPAPLHLIGKVTILFGNENPTYERAIKSHALHNNMHDYKMYILRRGILSDVWTKPAYILSVILTELAKPVHERLEWLLWFDADTVLINPQIPIEIFLPPRDFQDVNLLVTNDMNGLNNGVFPIRVCAWSAELLSAVVAFREYRPNFHLTFRDQSALDEVLKFKKYRDRTVWLPQRWFNAYQGGGAEVNHSLSAFDVRRGDLLVHFAGVPDRERMMEHWLDIVNEHLPEWEVDVKYTSYLSETRQFWAEERGRRDSAIETLVREQQKAQDLLSLDSDQMRRMGSKLTENDSMSIREAHMKLEAVLRLGGPDREDILAVQKAVNDLTSARAPLMTVMSNSHKDIIKLAQEIIFDASSILRISGRPGFSISESEHANLAEKTRELRKMVLDFPDNDIEIEKLAMELKEVSDVLAKKIQEERDRVENEHTEKLASWEEEEARLSELRSAEEAKSAEERKEAEERKAAEEAHQENTDPPPTDSSPSTSQESGEQQEQASPPSQEGQGETQ